MVDYHMRMSENLNKAREIYNIHYHDNSEIKEAMDNLGCLIEETSFTDSLEVINDIGNIIGKPLSPSQDPNGFVIWSNLQEVRNSIYALKNKK